VKALKASCTRLIIINEKHITVTVSCLKYEMQKGGRTCETGCVVVWQCQVVLQGKSRSLIVRELQRTVGIYRVDGICVVASELYTRTLTCSVDIRNLSVTWRIFR